MPGTQNSVLEVEVKDNRYPKSFDSLEDLGVNTEVISHLLL